MPNARHYELVIYEVGDNEGESTEFSKTRIHAGATTWTPSLDGCLERGGRYAWSARAITDGNNAAEWSVPSLFEVSMGPSEAEFETALEVVKSYLAGEMEGAESVATAEESPPREETKRPATSGAPATRAAPATTQLSVDGNIDATSFTGDGSNLTGLGNPDGPCFDFTYRFVDCGNGTVTDTATWLIYLKNANCFGSQDWVAANQSAAGLADGSCGLTDGSRPGDWRLQTRPEWEGILDSSCTTEPKIVGNQSPTPGCYTDASDPDSEWASGLLVDTYWASSLLSNTTGAEGACLYNGTFGCGGFKSANLEVWPVRGGQ